MEKGCLEKMNVKKSANKKKSRPAKMLPLEFLMRLACPACRKAVRQQGGILICRGCGARYPVVEGIPVMAPANSDPEFKKTLAQWNSFWKKQPLLPDGNVEADPAFADALRHIRRFAPGPDWGAFLEAGCGDGRKGLVIAREGHGPVFGVDGCLEACRLARRLFEREGEAGYFVVGDLRALPFQDRAFKYIYAGGSLEHFSNTAVAVREANRVLQTGGRLTATVPFLSLANLGYGQLWGNIPDLPVLRPVFEWVHRTLLGGGHLRYGYEKSFTRGGILRYFQAAGFSNLDCNEFETHMEFLFLPRPWMKRLARTLARWKWFWPVIYVNGDRKP